VRARHLDVGLGRWLSQDPLNVASEIAQFIYSANDPVRLTDPTGLQERGRVDIDQVGAAILFRWLYGNGAPVRYDSGLPGASQMFVNYMMRLDAIAGLVRGELGAIQKGLLGLPTGSSLRRYYQIGGKKQLPGFDESYNIFPSGKSPLNLTGAALLNGPNLEVGGLEIWVVATKIGPRQFQFRGTCKWSDLIDPNPTNRDDLFAWFGNVISRAQAADYEIHIRWQFEAEYALRGPGKPPLQAGWPFVLPDPLPKARPEEEIAR
jgi:hypothetical protein